MHTMPVRFKRFLSGFVLLHSALIYAVFIDLLVKSESLQDVRWGYIRRLLIEWSLVRIQPGEPKKIKNLRQFSGYHRLSIFPAGATLGATSDRDALYGAKTRSRASRGNEEAATSLDRG